MAAAIAGYLQHVRSNTGDAEIRCAILYVFAYKMTQRIPAPLVSAGSKYIGSRLL
jgi:hypothetical protein